MTNQTGLRSTITLIDRELRRRGITKADFELCPKNLRHTAVEMVANGIISPERAALGIIDLIDLNRPGS